MFPSDWQLLLDEYDRNSEMMKLRLSKDLFSGTVDALVEDVPHLLGSEWDAIGLVSMPCTHNRSRQNMPLAPP